MEGSIIAVEPPKGSQGLVWIIKTTANDCISDLKVCNSYSNEIIAGEKFLIGHFLERKKQRDYTLCPVLHKTAYVYRETILYPQSATRDTRF